MKTSRRVAGIVAGVTALGFVSYEALTPGSTYRILMNEDDKQGHGPAFDNVTPNGEIIARLPDRLPPEVAKQRANVGAAIVRYTVGKGKNAQGHISVSSVVRTGPTGNTFMGAGHALMDDKGKAVCNPGSSMTVIMPTERLTTTVKVGGKQYKVHGQARTAQAAYAYRSDAPDRAGVVDASFIATGTFDEYARTKPAEPRTDQHVVTPGQDLYTMNYEPTQGGEQRSPAGGTPERGTANVADALKRLSAPAQVGGIALGTEVVNGRTELLMLTGIPEGGYGPDGENRVRGGASGGGVFDHEGHIVGTVATVAPMSMAEVTERYHITLTGPNAVDPSTQMQVVGVQEVTSSTVTALEDQLAAAPTCFK